MGGDVGDGGDCVGWAPRDVLNNRACDGVQALEMEGFEAGGAGSSRLKHGSPQYPTQLGGAKAQVDKTLEDCVEAEDGEPRRRRGSCVGDVEDCQARGRARREVWEDAVRGQ